MKTLTLHQSWASLIAHRWKRYETRSWATAHRGKLAIHAGKECDREFWQRLRILSDYEAMDAELPTGAVLCVVQLSAVHRITYQFRAEIERTLGRELKLGNFNIGRYAWAMEVLYVFAEPVPARGQQGLWDWDARS